ncbi:MAG: ribulose-phosphate 3-epimerase [Holosporaceae bacterium]|jgi:ribulose-phosphate 3-epimerase|nr:ribulose-phosphate 3-epimerase [Holosporaceae bacterium]
MLVCPSMLSANSTKLGEELINLEKSGADSIHWDVMDGSFVEAITFGHHVIADHRKLSNLRFDVHLMVENPEKHMENFAQAGADVIIVHPEACGRLHSAVDRIKSIGLKSGVALNPATPVDVLKYCVDELDMVLVMGVNPGSSGQSFIESQLKKIAQLGSILPPSAEICVDGGMNDQTVKECAKCGANSVVSGSYIFKNSDYAAAIAKLKENSR